MKHLVRGTHVLEVIATMVLCAGWHCICEAHPGLQSIGFHDREFNALPQDGFPKEGYPERMSFHYGGWLESAPTPGPLWMARRKRERENRERQRNREGKRVKG